MKTIELPLWEILVPHKMGEHDNTNIDIPKRRRIIPVPYHQQWDKFVRSVTGGLTIHKAAQGQWQDKDGKLYKEIMIPVRIACTEDQIRQIAEFSLEFYKQKAIFVTLVSDKTLIFYADSEYPTTDEDEEVMFEVQGYAFVSQYEGLGIMGHTTCTESDDLIDVVKSVGSATYRELYQIDLDREAEADGFTDEHEAEIMARPVVEMIVGATLEIVKHDGTVAEIE